jgi:hypothetical protein
VTSLATEHSADAHTATAIAALLSVAAGGAPHQVIVVAADAPPALQMPAAGLSAESGAPILLVSAAGVPATTAAALTNLHHPAIYLLDAPALTASTLTELARLGHIERVASPSGTPSSPSAAESGDPVANSISVARFASGSFGWGIHEAGHGVVFANASRPLDAPAAAPLSAHGDYGPLLLLENGASIPTAVAHYLSDIEPGYTRAIQPVHGVYNHGWLIGDEHAISAVVQAELDTLLEIAPRSGSAVEASATPIE